MRRPVSWAEWKKRGPVNLLGLTPAERALLMWVETAQLQDRCLVAVGRYPHKMTRNQRVLTRLTAREQRRWTRYLELSS